MKLLLSPSIFVICICIIQMRFATLLVTPVISSRTRTGRKLIISMQNSGSENSIGLYMWSENIVRIENIWRIKIKMEIILRTEISLVNTDYWRDDVVFVLYASRVLLIKFEYSVCSVVECFDLPCINKKPVKPLHRSQTDCNKFSNNFIQLDLRNLKHYF